MYFHNVHLFLNNQDEINNFPEIIKHKSLIETHKDKSGDIFAKKLFIKCFEMSINEKLISASNEDIVNNEYPLMCGETPVKYFNYKMFVGKMINNIYDYKYDPTEFDNMVKSDGVSNDIQDYNIIYDACAIELFQTEILIKIKKELLIKNVLDYMSTLQENDLNSGKKLFSLLVNVFYEMYEIEKNVYVQDTLLIKDKLMFALRKIYDGMNSILEYKSKFYCDDESSNDDDDDNVKNDNNDTCDLHDDTTKLVDYESSDNDTEIKNDKENVINLLKTLHEVITSIVEPNKDVLFNDQTEYAAMYETENNNIDNVTDFFKQIYDKIEPIFESKNLSNKRKSSDEQIKSDKKRKTD